jgi:hypothetical protein
MPAGLLTAQTVMTCPHGGMVTAIPNSPRVSMAGAPAVYAADSFMVDGCPFAPGAPQPCTTVRWQVASQTGSGAGAATLTLDSVGFCYGATGALQGMVLIQATQAMVSGS